jgi:hypothetical protein
VTPLQFFVVIAAGIAGGVYVWQPLFTKKKVFCLLLVLKPDMVFFVI